MCRRSLKIKLSQLKSDCGMLNLDIDTLQAQIREKMIRKFGMIVDFDEMEEAVMRKAVADHEPNRTINDDSAKLIALLEVNIFSR